MKFNKLTSIERQVVSAWKAEGLDVKASAEWIRAKVRRTAFHEAGHVAARMFTGHEASHIVHVSIIPDGQNHGHERSYMFSESFLERWPPAAMRSAGRCLLLGLLAGRGCEAVVAEPEDREDILDEDALWWEGEEQGTDLCRALRIADIMARPGMPARRILSLAEKWTVEMLELPEVWRTVETLSALLLARGVLEQSEIFPVCESIEYLGLTLPKWRRRLAAKLPGDN